MITCGTPDGSDEDDGKKKTDQDTNKDGLPYNHAFSLMGTLQLKDSDGNQFNLLELRNPWGTEKWKGDWSDTSELWTEELREQVKYFETGDDGKFYMSIEDYFWQVKYTEFNRDVTKWNYSYYSVH